MKAHEKLSQLWYEMKAEDNCIQYVDEMISQLKTLTTETNTLTKETIKTKLLTLVDTYVVETPQQITELIENYDKQ
jgi:hypothetical protein